MVLTDLINFLRSESYFSRDSDISFKEQSSLALEWIVDASLRFWLRNFEADFFMFGQPLKCVDRKSFAAKAPISAALSTPQISWKISFPEKTSESTSSKSVRDSENSFAASNWLLPAIFKIIFKRNS